MFRSLQLEQMLPVPTEISGRLEHYAIESSSFIDTLRNYSRCFFTMVGQAHRIDTESERRGYKRRPGIGASRRLYRPTG